MDKEIWKSVPNYMGYEVSNLGRVRSLDRTSPKGYNVKGKVLNQYYGGGGYLQVGLNKRPFYVHQLVAIAFLGHVPNGRLIVVDHMDNNKLNNNLNNLQVVTQRENASKDRRNKTSRFTGVSWYKWRKTWVVHIRVNGKNVTLGYFKNEIDAHNAYQKKLAEISK